VRASEPFPIIYAGDVDESVAFYVEAFGFEIGYRWPGEGPIRFAHLKLPGDSRGIGIGGADGNVHGLPVGHGPARFELCLYVDDMDDASSRLRALGAAELRPPVDEPWGERRAYFADRDGNPIHLAMSLRA
jgi:catechol 2,3-dioxygenase-like lactoylglutathione lyase family enzyme